jgi:beta-galactosidase
MPSIAPGQAGEAELAGWTRVATSGGERWLGLSFVTASEQNWAPVGHEICWDQVRVDGTLPSANLADGSEPVALDADGHLEHPALAVAPRLSLWRAPTDNDRISGLGHTWQQSGLANPLEGPPQVSRDGATVRVDRDIRVGQSVVRCQQVFSAGADGSVHAVERADIPPELDDLPRVGTVLELAAGPEALEWFGLGPHETYPDRKRSGLMGRWRSTVSEQLTPYVMPQEAGGHADVRWIELRDPSGAGWRLTMGRPMQVSVSHYRAADVDVATHVEELAPRAETIIHIDAIHRGLGTASCGPDTTDPFRCEPGTYTWEWSIEPLA